MLEKRQDDCPGQVVNFCYRAQALQHAMETMTRENKRAGARKVMIEKRKEDAERQAAMQERKEEEDRILQARLADAAEEERRRQER